VPMRRALAPAPPRAPGSRPARAVVLARAAAAGACALLLCQCASFEHGAQPQLLSHGPFDVYVYRPQGTARNLVLFLSGDGGWSSELGTIAQRLTVSGALVAGINVRRLLAEYRLDSPPCVSAGADLTELSRYLRERFRLGPSSPVLIGHSAGATLAFVALAQSPAGTFAGALTLSFCEDLDLVKPLCRAPAPQIAIQSVPRSDGVRLLPPARLPAPWIALHGLEDEVCPASEARVFVDAIHGARFVGLPGITHSYHHMSRWWQQFEAAYLELAAPASAPAAAAP
jgi:type IV secretory pathway VirJ component